MAKINITAISAHTCDEDEGAIVCVKTKKTCVTNVQNIEGFMANFFNTLCFVYSLDYGISNMDVVR